MTEEELGLLEFEIEHTYYYIGYPDNVRHNFWKDGAGEFKFMPEMGLDHLKSCIKKVEKDIAALEHSGRPSAVIDAIHSRSSQKLDELKAVFSRKVNS
ncbi:hypothetical protein [Azospirillum sp.]|uniref:hypothetical protein n=1 Tax=Azospirillum sp. TaxID=34012 RepID=UPI002D3D4CBC|nr:hypothetical protein [Azospirillum sp.]HYD69965.1 hypothetical protein [Azospirillum sp.]